MAKVLHCRDIGMDCNFVTRAETEQEILQQIAEHAQAVHDMTEIPEELVQTMRAAIRDE